jgi:hypothetical protein
VSPENEHVVLGALAQSVRTLLEGYPTTDEDDEALMMLDTLPAIHQATVRLRMRERSLLRRAVARQERIASMVENGETGEGGEESGQGGAEEGASSDRDGDGDGEDGEDGSEEAEEPDAPMPDLTYQLEEAKRNQTLFAERLEFESRRRAELTEAEAARWAAAIGEVSVDAGRAEKLSLQFRAGVEMSVTMGQFATEFGLQLDTTSVQALTQSGKEKIYEQELVRQKVAQAKWEAGREAAKVARKERATQWEVAAAVVRFVMQTMLSS